VNVVEQDAARFVEWTLRSKFCLAPRGYGRSSFRFFEAMQLDTIPVYLWDDIEWLPYKDVLDYSTFSISISRRDLPQLYDRLRSISDDTYQKMKQELLRVRRHFTLEGMAEYIVGRITK
jgi:xylogalacturonan beta-1,3-xylosyltransferase